MTHTLTIRLTPELDRWLRRISKETGIPKSDLVRRELERARTAGRQQRFMRLAGSVDLAPDLSSRKGYGPR